VIRLPFAIDRTGIRIFVAALGTFAVVAPLTKLAGQPDGLRVLGVVVAVVASRRAARRGASATLESAVALPVVAVLTSLTAWLLVHDRYVAEGLIVVAMYVSIASRTAPPPLARAARLLTLPMIVLGRRLARIVGVSAHEASVARVAGVRAAAAKARALAGESGGPAIGALRRDVRDMRRALVAA
jgi:hypothetical protein